MIAVVGSINMDLSVHVPVIPAVGETVLGTSFAQSPGGKGANQAVAAARLGSRVAFVGCLGKTPLGTPWSRGYGRRCGSPPISGAPGRVRAELR